MLTSFSSDKGVCFLQGCGDELLNRALRTLGKAVCIYIEYKL